MAPLLQEYLRYWWNEGNFLHDIWQKLTNLYGTRLIQLCILTTMEAYLWWYLRNSPNASIACVLRITYLFLFYISSCGLYGISSKYLIVLLRNMNDLELKTTTSIHITCLRRPLLIISRCGRIRQVQRSIPSTTTSPHIDNDLNLAGFPQGIKNYIVMNDKVIEEWWGPRNKS